MGEEFLGREDGVDEGMFLGVVHGRLVVSGAGAGVGVGDLERVPIA